MEEEEEGYYWKRLLLIVADNRSATQKTTHAMLPVCVNHSQSHVDEDGSYIIWALASVWNVIDQQRNDV